MRLYEAISKENGSTFNIRGVELKLNRFTLGIKAKYEAEGLDIDEVMRGSKPVFYITKIAFDLMDKESRLEFNDNIEVFRDCLSMNDVEVLVKAVQEAIENSMPIPKNEEGVKLQEKN